MKIGDIDEHVGGGTHVKNLQEIGKIEITKTVNKGKNNRRMYFVLKLHDIVIYYYEVL